MILILAVLINAFSFIVSAEGETSSETETSLSSEQTSVPGDENAPSGFEALNEHQQIVFLLSCLAGLFLAQAFSFWKW